MAEIWTMGELLVEIMRPEADMRLDQPGVFLGPYPSGAPGIMIDTVARLGHSAGIVSGVGDDDFGKCLLERLSNDGVDCTHVFKSKEYSTGVAFVTYFNDGSRKFIYHIGNTPAAQAKALALSNPAECKYFHIMGCSLMANAGFAQEILKMMRGLRKQGSKISFDPNIRPELLGDGESMSVVDEVMQNCSVFLPGEQELLLVSGEKTVKAAVKKCFDNPVLEVIVMKNGSKGCTVFSRDGSFSIGVYPVEVKDPTGAGDSFDGAFLCSLIDGKALAEAARYASAAAAIGASAFGPMEGAISNDAIQAMIEANKDV